jgi:cell division initiation protein
MGLTPVELRHLRFGRRLLGYRRRDVDRLLAEATESFEEVWRERADLADRVEHLEEDLVRYRELETLLRTTLVSAERAAHDLKAQATREAELILGEAHAAARAARREATSERERLLGEARRVRALLQAALRSVDETGAGEAAPPERPPGEDTAQWEAA